MNKNALSEYALFARKELETQISLSLNNFGIYKDHISRADKVGERTIIQGIQETYPLRIYDLRNRIIDQFIKEEGFESTVEEFAYTWFNRIIALRFMEVHDYLPHGFHVLTSPDGSYEPEILQNLEYAKDDLGIDMNVVEDFRSKNDIEGLYRYVLFSQCNALSDTLPMLFGKQQAYMELLLPNNLLSQGSVIRRITDIPEEDFRNDVEVIGWLYQFYNSVKKDEVFASKKAITKETLPAVTQLFTPDWIVRYMAQNSVGRIWLESYPTSPLKEKMKYYVEDAPQEEDVQKKLEEIRYKDVSPENIKVIEPCCGSGHILVYVFDLLVNMYLEKGYVKQDIPALILKNNLTGLDVDKRAAQLSQFALMMKARSIDPRFFNSNRIVFPHVYEIVDSSLLYKMNYKEIINSFGFTSKSLNLIDYLAETYQDAKVIGSLLKVRKDDYQYLFNEISRKQKELIANTLQIEFFEYGLPLLKRLCILSDILSRKYDVMITNPPYCGSSNIEKDAKNYFGKYYPNSKADMFAMFMETGFPKKNGFTAMINMQSWMFLDSFENLRVSLLASKTIYSLTHLGARAFESIGGEVVQTVSFVLRNNLESNFQSSFFRLIHINTPMEKEKSFLRHENKYLMKENVFSYLPGNTISYWVSRFAIKAFENRPLSSYGNTKAGLSTGNNDRFLKLWFEPSFSNIAFDMNNNTEFICSKKKFVPCNKGGNFRRWYGNNEYVIDWTNPSSFHRPRTTYMNLYYKPALTWSVITSSLFNARYYGKGFLFDHAAASFFSNNSEEALPVLGFLNSKVSQYYLNLLNPTLNTGADVLSVFPIHKDIFQSNISQLVQENIFISKIDWDSFETSWGFPYHPLVKCNTYIKFAYSEWEKSCLTRFEKLKANEEELNKIFISIYQLKDELSENVDEKSISIRLANKERDIKSLISYFLGIVFGRYSLDVDGLAYAGGPWDSSKYVTYHPDEDGVIQFYSMMEIKNGVTERIIQLIKHIYGEDTYKENIAFIADALGKKGDESPEETLHRYLMDSFYADHLKTYQKRPIYWMLSSGKHKAFQCLFYLHRYNKNTLALINTKYFLPTTQLYKNEHSRLQDQINIEEDARKKNKLQKQLDEVIACEKELYEYGQVLDHMANQYIDLDLDDGVKVNYQKFQQVELEVEGKTIKKDLLIPIK